ncbi:MAG TPA: chemotaxis protein CheC [Bacillota bacterium]|jgi:chemotaxis protein CheC|nr:chemotaxis protein CheC [Bacillota bacterium]HOL10033.1 chemotaxis protein CheC [Bacillota bacterium]HPO97783.1 chemotaxis protein CheC [Bacillota bacterium]
MKIEDLNSTQLDVLKEIGNIGSGHAATALSQLLLDKIEMTVPNVKILPLEEVSNYLGGAEELVVGIYMKVFGDAPGKLMYIFKNGDAQKLVNMVADSNLLEMEHYQDYEQSVLEEISNIMTGAYLNALTKLTNLTMLSSVPAYSCDMAGAIINSALLDLGMLGEYALLIETRFSTTTQQLDGDFFLIPDPGALEVILEALGVE